MFYETGKPVDLHECKNRWPALCDLLQALWVGRHAEYYRARMQLAAISIALLQQRHSISSPSQFVFYPQA